MPVKICGHQVRWQKPIKIYTLLKLAALLMAVNLLAAGPGSAAEPSSFPRAGKTSAIAAPCLPAQKTGMVSAAPRIHGQRAAAVSSMSPAMALALALGVRNIPGPMVHTARHAARTKPPSLPLEQQAMLLPRDKGCAPALSANLSQPAW